MQKENKGNSAYTRHIKYLIILDGVGLVNNKPSTDYRNQFVKKKRKMKHVTCDM